MKVKLGILHLSKNLEWSSWPTWLKGLFLLWPSLGPAYLFITRTPRPTDGTGEITTILSNIEYQNYFISVFLGLWAINLVVLGITWVMGSLISEGYREHIGSRTKIPTAKIFKKKINSNPEATKDENDGNDLKKLKKRS